MYYTLHTLCDKTDKEYKRICNTHYTHFVTKSLKNKREYVLYINYKLHTLCEKTDKKQERICIIHYTQFVTKQIRNKREYVLNIRHTYDKTDKERDSAGLFVTLGVSKQTYPKILSSVYFLLSVGYVSQCSSLYTKRA